MSFKKPNQWQNNDHMYIKQIDSSYIDYLFGLIRGGEYDKIHRFTQEKNVSLNVQDKQGKTPIHIILEDTINNLNEQQRYDLVYYFIHNNCPVSMPDNMNIRPIHIACKYHYKKIIELLLDNGADINVTDNSGMNPLHYACQGYSKLCKEPKYIKKLIPKETKKNITKEFKVLVNNIIEILKKPQYAIIMKNININIKMLNEILVEDFESKQKELSNSIYKINSNIDLNKMEKDKKIRDAYHEYYDYFTKLFKSRFSNTLKRLDINPNNKYSFNEDYNNLNILPYTHERMINTINIELKDAFKNINNVYSGFIKNIDNLTNEIVSGSGEILENIHYMLLNNYCAYLNKIGDEYVDWNHIRDNLLYPDDKLFYFQEINVYMKKHTDGEINYFPVPVISNNDCTPEFNNNENNRKFKQLTFLTLIGRAEKYESYRVKKSEKRANSQMFPLSNDTEYDAPIVGHTLSDLRLRANEFDYDPRNRVLRPDTAQNVLQKGKYLAYIPVHAGNHYKGMTYYSTSRFIFANLQIKKHGTIIKSNLNFIIEFLEKGVYNGIIVEKVISSIIVASINIIQYICFGLYEEQVISNSMNKLRELFVQICERNQSYSYYYLFENSVDHIDNILKSHKRIKKKYGILYTVMKNLVESLDTIYKYCSMKTLEESMKYFNAELTYKIKNVFTKNIPSIKKLPPTINDYVSNYYDIKEKRGRIKQIIEDFIPYINNSKNNFFIVDGTDIEKAIHALNNVQYYNCNNNHIIETRNLKFTKNAEPKYIHWEKNTRIFGRIARKTTSARIGYLIETVNNIEHPELPFIEQESKNKSNINDHYKGHPGLIGYIKTPKTKNKDDNLELSIGTYIDQFLNVQKLYIIENVLSYVKQFENNLVQLISNNVEELGLTNRDILNSMVYSIIGKYIDEILINNMTYLFDLSIKNNLKHILDKSYNIDLNDEIFSIDRGFKVNFGNLQDDIIFKYFAKNEYSDGNEYIKFFNKNMDDVNNETQIVKNYVNGITGDKSSKMCYNMDMSIIQLLIKKGININLQDMTKFTPLHYALKLNYPEIVKILIENGAFIHSTKFQKSPLKHFYEIQKIDTYLLSNTNSLYGIFDKLYKSAYKKITDNLYSKKEYANNKIQYLDNIIPQMLIIYNHQLYLYISNYLNGWTITDSTNLCTIFGDNTQFECIPNKLPILPFFVNTYGKDYTDTMSNVIDNIKYKNNKYIKINKELMNKVANYEEEKKIYRDDVKRINNLDVEIKKIMTVIKHNTLEIKKNTDEISKINKSMSDYKSNNSNKFNNKLGNIYDRTSMDITYYYDKILKLVDTKVYNNVWDTYLNSQNYLNIFNIHVLCELKLDESLNKLLNGNADNHKQLYSVFNDLYQKIFKLVINDSVQLEQLLNNTNIFLTHQINIIIHCVRSIIFSNMYDTIIRSLLNYINSINNEKLLNKSTFDDIMNDNTIRSLNKYIIDRMPIICTKLILDLWNDNDDVDVDRKLDIDTVFSHITSKITECIIIPIQQSSSFIKNVNDYVIPYYKDIVTKMIPEMKKILDNYNNYILYQANNIQIMTYMLN